MNLFKQDRDSLSSSAPAQLAKCRPSKTKYLQISGTALLAMLTMGLLGCSSSSSGNSSPSITPVVAIAANSGTPQSHAINGAFGTPLVAMVTSNGLPASGVAVTFQAPTTGATVTFSGKSSATATSNSQGLATVSDFSANGMVGVYSVTASAPGVQTPATFSLSNTTGAPAAVNATGGTPQSAAVDSAFATPLQVTVLDSGNNPVGNAVVVFSAPNSGASGTFTDPTGASVISTAALTNASGVAASTTFTANGIAGPVAVTATVAGVASPANFALTNLAGTANTITAISGTPQSAIAGNQFVPMSVLVVDVGQNPVANATVTFTAPTTGASGTFNVGGINTNIATVATDTSGIATSPALTANATAGTYTVSASAGTTPANFTLTNWPSGSFFFSFYLSGQENLNGLIGFYTLAGSVLIGPTGSVIAGEQDYNDGLAYTSPQPSGDTITGGTLKLNGTSHLGTLTLITNNLNLGVGGTETLAIQFVNSDHALISQFDGTATSSGSLDLQTLPSPANDVVSNGGYAFTLTGIDPFTFPVGYGGVFTVAGGNSLQNGLVDTNDAGIGVPVLDAALTGTFSAPDTFGRGTITTSVNYNNLTGTTSPIALNYYIVGPEAIRIIAVDPTDTAIGSAFGQGSGAGSFSNSSLGTSIFGLAGTTYALSQYGTAGMFTANSSAGTFSGVADDGELSYGIVLPQTAISGTYSVANSGYGNFTIPAGDLGDVSALGLYVTDPNLNLLDPNNTSNGGGALLLDLDPALTGGMGLVIPQTDTSTGSFAGDYGFNGQDQNFLTSAGEFDFVGAAVVTSGTLGAAAEISDPFLTLGAKSTNGGVTFSGTPQPDSSNPGRYTLFSTNATPNPLTITIRTVPQQFDVVMYQANGDQVFWLNEDFASVFFGSLQQFGPFTSPHSAIRMKEAKEKTK